MRFDLGARDTHMEIAIDRISPITTLLDEVLFQSSIDDMRNAYFQYLKDLDSWMILSDYYLAMKKRTR
jgi:hypothetical protein